jgi:hypothetical protein
MRCAEARYPATWMGREFNELSWEKVASADRSSRRQEQREESRGGSVG